MKTLRSLLSFKRLCAVVFLVVICSLVVTSFSSQATYAIKKSKKTVLAAQTGPGVSLDQRVGQLEYQLTQLSFGDAPSITIVDTAGGNLLRNTSFEAGGNGSAPSQWSYQLDSTSGNTFLSQEGVHSGNEGLKFLGGGTGNFGISQPSTKTTPQRTYTFSAFVKIINAPTVTFRLGFWNEQNNKEGTFKNFTLSGTKDWQRVYISTTTSGQITDAKNWYPMIEVLGLQRGNVYLDDVQLTEGSVLTTYNTALANGFSNSLTLGDGSILSSTTGDLYPAQSGVGNLGTANNKWNALNLSKATIDNNGNLTLSGGLTIGALGSGIVHLSSSGVASSSAVNLNSSDITSTLAVGNGGTGLTTTPTNGQLLIGNGTGYSLATLTAGSNITITNASGAITIASTGGGGSTAFSSLTGGTNTSAAMVVGSGGSLTTSGTGTITATTVTGLTVASGKTLTANNSLTLVGTDGTTMTFPGSSDTVVGTAATQTLTNKTLTAPTIQGTVGAGTGLTLPTFTASGNITGSGSPTISSFGAINGLTLTANATGFSIAGGTTSKTLTMNNTLTLAGTDSTTITFQGTDTYVGRATTDTLTNKTLTTPKITTSLLDTNGNTWLNQTAAGSAVNYLTLADSATGVNPSITAAGTDTNIGLNLVPKGSGNIQINGQNISLAGALTTSGANSLTLTTTGATNVTLPTSGTLAITGAQTFTGAQTINSTSANALAVGANGATNPGFNVDASTASSATGLNVKSAAAGGGIALSAISSGVNENLTLDAKGSGTLTINGTATGGITLGRATTVTTGGLTISAGGATITGAITGTSTSANALTIGANGATNPALNVDASTASSATGLNVKSAAAAGGLAVNVISSGANESFTLNAKGTGTVTINGTATGGITLGQATTVTTGGLTISAGGATITGAITGTSSSANALAIGLNGTTNPAFNVDASTASSATGLNIKSAAAAGGLAVSVISSGANENLTFDAKGTGTVTINGTATGGITLGRATTVTTGGLTISAGGATITGAITGTSTSTSALAVGANGSTNPVLNVNANTASVATGLNVSGAAAGGGIALAAISSGANENLTLDAKGTGTITLNGTATGNITTPRGLVSTGTAGVGYATGAGGTVTQLTSKSTGVTLNKTTGQITMNIAALAAATSVTFTLTNSTIAATDTVIVNIASGNTANSYQATIDAVGAGSCNISLRNISGGSLGEAVVLNFVVIKGASS